MNRNELRDQVSSKTDLTNAQVDAVLGATWDAIVDAVASGDKVSLAGFGIFEPRERSARTGRNPQTGAEIEIAATTAPAFKPAAAFKKKVAGE